MKNKKIKITNPQKEFSDEMIAKTLDYQKKYNFDIGDGSHPTWNTEGDAFKHAYMQWYLSNKFGESTAKILGDFHEANGGPAGEHNMDLWNNQIGREVYSELSKELGEHKQYFSADDLSDLAAEKIMEKMKNGDMILSPDDSRKFENMEFERLKPENKVYYNGELDNIPEQLRQSSMNSYLEQAIDNNWKIPEKSELDKQVKTGDLIYVDDYTKSDGTKVSGYYRKK